MAIIVFSRLGGLFFLFVLLARVLEVDEFGQFVIAYSIAAVVVLVIDYGFAQSLLKEIGSDSRLAAKRLTTGLFSKALLSVVAIIIATCILIQHFGSLASGGLFLALFANATLSSFAEYFGAAMRSIRRYTEEAGVQFIATLLILVGVYFGGTRDFDALDFALFMMLVRAMQALVVGYLAVRSIGVESQYLTISHVRDDLKRGVPYAADQGISNLLLNIDVLIVGAMLGTYSAGLYQAGQKLVQGYSAGALVISNVYLPRLAHHATKAGGQWRKEANSVAYLMVLAGSLGGAALIVLPEFITLQVYGQKFLSLVDLLPLFGILVILRFVTGVLGLLLTSTGHQAIRLYANSFSLCVVIASASIFVQFYGVKGMLYAQLLAVSVLFIAYSFGLYRKVTV